MFLATLYLKRALTMLGEPALRRWVILPLLFNIVLFGTLFWLAGGWLSGWIAALGSGLELEGALAFLNVAIDAGLWVLQLVAWLVLLMVMASSFTIVVQLVAAPFMGFLAEQVDRRVAESPMPEESLTAMAVRTSRRELVKTWHWLWRTLLVGLLVLVLWLIPGLNLLAPVVWFLWSGWLLGLQYIDYGADNRQVSFRAMQDAAGQRRWLVLSFGALVLVFTMIPLINLMVMPVAVIGGTLIWLKELDQKP